MSIIIGGLMGVFIGVTLFALVSATKIQELNGNVKQYRKKYINEKDKVNQRDILIKDYQKENTILLICAKEDKERIKDLENNIEILANNVPELKELVAEHQSNN